MLKMPFKIPTILNLLHGQEALSGLWILVFKAKCEWLKRCGRKKVVGSNPGFLFSFNS